MFDANTIFIRVDPRDVNFVNRIMEGHEYLGVVTTVDKTRGILAVRATADTAADARIIIGRLPVALSFLEKPE